MCMLQELDVFWLMYILFITIFMALLLLSKWSKNLSLLVPGIYLYLPGLSLLVPGIYLYLYLPGTAPEHLQPSVLRRLWSCPFSP